jgi:N-acetylneuraminic acid mutarotase
VGGVCVVLGLVFLLVCCLFGEVSVFAAYVSSPEENVWAEMAPMQQPRSHLGAAAVNGKIYTIGGQTSSYQQYGVNKITALNTTEVYDPVTNSWTYRTPMPVPSSGFAVAVCENKIYCISSVEGFNLVYDSVLDIWENKTAMPISSKGAQANVVDGKIYLLLGYHSGSRNWVYDPLNNWGLSLFQVGNLSDFSFLSTNNNISF